ncbi:hypothetical protein LUU34_01274400 [Aix galericulata]|nr:hypothetical protein LUU34_01274400 [Aix galericulata]
MGQHWEQPGSASAPSCQVSAHTRRTPLSLPHHNQPQPATRPGEARPRPLPHATPPALPLAARDNPPPCNPPDVTPGGGASAGALKPGAGRGRRSPGGREATAEGGRLRRGGGTTGTMREIVHIQAGQCGNQIGAKVPPAPPGGCPAAGIRPR